MHTQARRLDQAEAMAREAVALMLDADPAAIRVEVLPEVPSTVSQALEARHAARQAEEDAERAAAAARKLLEDGYTVRDAGTLLHLSPQRVSQIAPLARPGTLAPHYRSGGALLPASRAAVLRDLSWSGVQVAAGS